MKYAGIYGACNHVASKLNHIKTIVDLGARHGEGYELFGKKFEDSTYVFVEPSPRCIPIIQQKIALEVGKDLRLIDGVIGKDSHEVEFFLLESDHDQSGNLYSDRKGIYGKSDTVSVKSYDYRKIVKEIGQIDFLKCNIEGGEYDLLETTFFDNVKAFVMEAHNAHVPGKTYLDVLDKLNDKFDMEVWGDTNYKYCFINGIRKI